MRDILEAYIMLKDSDNFLPCCTGTPLDLMYAYLATVVDSSKLWLCDGPWALKNTCPLTPTNHLSDHDLFDLIFGDLLVTAEVKGLVEGDDGEHISMRTVTQRRRRANIRRSS